MTLRNVLYVSCISLHRIPSSSLHITSVPKHSIIHLARLCMSRINFRIVTHDVTNLRVSFAVTQRGLLRFTLEIIQTAQPCRYKCQRDRCTM
jgi:hypothetical protein